MNTSIKVIAATLGMVAILGTAQAEGLSADPGDRALHMAIAMQGDQALVEFRSALVDSISQTIYQQMDELIQHVDASWLLEGDADQQPRPHRAGSAARVAAVAEGY